MFIKIIDSEFTKLEDDETCALLKPHKNNEHHGEVIVSHIWEIFKKLPHVKNRIKLKLNTEQV